LPASYEKPPDLQGPGVFRVSGTGKTLR